MIAAEYFLELGADGAVEVFDILGIDALAIGRVGDHYAGCASCGSLVPMLERADAQIDILVHACREDVAFGYVDGFG